jgi:hypothetical protein
MIASGGTILSGSELGPESGNMAKEKGILSWIDKIVLPEQRRNVFVGGRIAAWSGKMAKVKVISGQTGLA